VIIAAWILLVTVGATAGFAVLVALHHHLAHRRDRWRADQTADAAVAERAARLAAGRIDHRIEHGVWGGHSARQLKALGPAHRGTSKGAA